MKGDQLGKQNIWVISNNIPPSDDLQIYMLVYSASH